MLGYVSYALNRVGEVAASAADVDTIMSYGFNWAPPTAIVDLIGAKNTVAMLEKLKLTVPATVEQAASRDAKMFCRRRTRIRPDFCWIMNPVGWLNSLSYDYDSNQ